MSKNIQKKTDNTFIIDFKGFPFHVTPDYPLAEQYGEEYTYAKVKEYADAHPEEVTEYVEPVLEAPELTEEEQKTARLYTLERDAQKLIPAIQAGIDAEYNQQLLIDIMLEIEELRGNI